MEFVTDKQTLDDLNILGRYKNSSIYSLFNRTITIGGGRLMEDMFNHPLTSVEQINTRKEVFSLFGKMNTRLPFDAAEFEKVEDYLRNIGTKSRAAATLTVGWSKLSNSLVNDRAYVVLKDGVENTVALLPKLKAFVDEVARGAEGSVYHGRAQRVAQLINDPKLKPALAFDGSTSLSFSQVAKLDHILRGTMKAALDEILKEIYEMDVCIAVSNTARDHEFAYAQAVEREERFVDLKGVYHPSIPNAVSNDIHIAADKKVFFLTGANMAGKSTLMKSFAVSIYLAHMGFPVAAKEMTFSIHDGIYTSINVPDNLDMGYSHFYAEVLRVKHVAEEVASGKQLVVIFDELFKGTNVKDANDGTIAIVDAFSKRDGTYIISTHIMEAGEELMQKNERLFFRYLPTIVKDNVPTYTYTLQDGITDDRQGMMIIQNERILDIINGTIGVAV